MTLIATASSESRLQNL